MDSINDCPIKCFDGTSQKARNLIVSIVVAWIISSCGSVQSPGLTITPTVNRANTPPPAFTKNATSTTSSTPSLTRTATQTSSDIPKPTETNSTAPVISDIELIEEISSGNLTIYQYITFTDLDGDANYVDYELVSSTNEDIYVIDGEIDIPGDQQALEAVVTGSWDCGPNTYSVTMQVSITDVAGNRSDFQEYTLECRIPAFTSSVEITTTEQLIFSLSEGWNLIPESILLSPDNRHIAFVVSDGDNWFVSVDGERGVLYEDVKKDMLFSPDGDHFAFIASEGEKVFVVLDGEEHRRYDEIGDLTFSPDSRHLAYRARLGDTEFVVLDGVEQKHYGFIVRRTLTFSPDSREIAYGASYETFTELLAGTGTYFAVVDGQEGKHYGGIGPSAIQIGTGDEKVYAEGPTYSPDGARLAYIALGDTGLMAVVDGVEGATYPPIANFLFSPDSQHYAYIVDVAKTGLVVLDGIEGPAFDSIRLGSLLFSPDGQSLAYIASDEAGEFVVVDEEPGKNYKQIFAGSLQFSPDSRRLMYVTVEANMVWCVVIDGQEDPKFNGVIPNSQVFSPDSQHVAYAVTIAEGSSFKDYIVIDGALVNDGYDFIPEIPLSISPDGLHLAFYARVGNRIALVINQQIVGEYDYIFPGEFSGLIFDSSTRFHFIGVQDDEIYLVEGEIMGNF